MSRMQSMGPHWKDLRSSRIVVVAVLLATVSACLVAYTYRGPLRCRYWAARLASAGDAAGRLRYLAALLNAGAASAWGATALTSHSEAEVRQCGALVLGRLQDRQSLERLLRLLSDEDEAVREAAAQSLAARGETAAIPTLMNMYRSGDSMAAEAACLALGRMETACATGVLSELASSEATPEARAALIDALAGLADTACVPALIGLLTDDRVCRQPSRRERRARAMLGVSRIAMDADDSAQFDAFGGMCVADRAAAAIERITGVHTGFATSQPADARLRAVEIWRNWYAQFDGE